MRQTIVVIVTLMVGAAIGGGFALRANSQNVTAQRNPSDNFETIKAFMWHDDGGRPAGVADENWISVKPSLGAIWEEQREGPDKLTWVVLRRGWWRATESATFDDVYRYHEG
jgi:hypothetical protein